jgi:hypothetical protein
MCGIVEDYAGIMVGSGKAPAGCRFAGTNESEGRLILSHAKKLEPQMTTTLTWWFSLRTPHLA